MEKTNQFYAVQVTTTEGEKALCWQDKKHFYFAFKTKGFKTPLPPTLFEKRAQAKTALSQRSKKGGNLKQFANVVEAKNHKIVKVSISVN